MESNESSAALRRPPNSTTCSILHTTQGVAYIQDVAKIDTLRLLFLVLSEFCYTLCYSVFRPLLPMTDHSHSSSTEVVKLALSDPQGVSEAFKGVYDR